ncbi:MAG: hypothetical protein M3247_06265 [Thermoproteota archaeon]|nr:hypothetical protein [Thermoproteota archaeon]
MDFSTAAEILKTLTALAGMISTYLATRKGKEHLEDKFKKEEKLGDKETQLILSAGDVPESAVVSEDIKILQSLPKDIGDACKNKIAKILRRYSEAINSPISVFELDKETEIAEFEICHTLRLIMRHNRGTLPTKQLRDLWERFNCDKTHD